MIVAVAVVFIVDCDGAQIDENEKIEYLHQYFIKIKYKYVKYSQYVH